jgi:acyl-CoA thioester hydrolase
MNQSTASDRPNERAGRPHHTSHARVTYRMTDQMGVVYYSHYFEWFEIGRTDLLRATGVTYRQMEEGGFFLPVVHAACDYLAPARYDDLLEIRTWIARLTRVRIDFDYEVARQGEAAILCRGVTRHAFTGSDGRPRRLAEDWMARIEKLRME